jgi:uncharacterized membrane protein YdjX (TVP38/TMEM64 family)
MNTRNMKNNIMNISTWIGFLAILIFGIYGYRTGLFSSIETFRKFFEGFGIWAALVFVVIQAIQVVVPILPGAVGCVAGIVIFGPWMGFLYNYTGICIGSILAFLLSKRYGRSFVRGVIGEKSYDKYIGWVNRGKKFDIFFALAIFFPVAPDDLLCYIAGLTKMELKKFIAIILLGKPASIAIYSLGLTAVGRFLISFIK